MRQVTVDREATPFYTAEKIGPKRSKTPEGFLLCEDVPLARTGHMLYAPGEVPVRTKDGMPAHVTRDAATLFDPITIGSFNGKPVVDEHPDGGYVCPKTWRTVSRGHVINPRRGTGDNADCIVADLLITDAATIRAVQSGKREVSAGYDANYEDLGNGEGRQTGIIGNHVALVERGRCGPRCAIGDHQSTSLQEQPMGTKTAVDTPRVRKEIPAAIRQLFKDAAEALADPGLADDAPPMPDPDAGGGDDNHTHIHIHSGEGGGDGGGAAPDDPIEARFQAIEGQLAQIVEMLQGGGGEEPPPEAGQPGLEGGMSSEDQNPEGGDGEGLPGDDDQPVLDHATVGDSAALATSYQALLSDAEVLVPGYKLPTLDAAQPRKATMDSMCVQRRRILDHLCSTGAGSALVESVSGGTYGDKTGCAEVALLFRAAAGARRLANNQSSTRDANTVPKSVTQQGAVGGLKSIADLNAMHRKHYAGKTAAK